MIPQSMNPIHRTRLHGVNHACAIYKARLSPPQGLDEPGQVFWRHRHIRVEDDQNVTPRRRKTLLCGIALAMVRCVRDKADMAPLRQERSHDLWHEEWRASCLWRTSPPLRNAVQESTERAGTAQDRQSIPGEHRPMLLRAASHQPQDRPGTTSEEDVFHRRSCRGSEPTGQIPRTPHGTSLAPQVYPTPTVKPVLDVRRYHDPVEGR